VRTDRATRKLVELRRYVETRYATKTWGKDKRRVVARIEASSLGLNVRFVTTSLTRGSAEYIYDTLYCARGQAENLIKLHKSQLKSDRTSCRSDYANQMRIILYTAAYWLMWAVRQAMPATNPLRNAEFSTVRLRLLKVAARSSRRPAPSMSPSPPAARMRCFSEASRSRYVPRAPDRRGMCRLPHPVSATPQALEPRDEPDASLLRVTKPERPSIPPHTILCHALLNKTG
jgi:hypothetical protein